MKIPDIAESIAIKLFTKEYGTDLLVRHNKFMEEVGELNQAFHEYRLKPTPERLQHLLDEYSDVQGTFTHSASLMALYQREMLHNCIDKVKGRKIDPNYKRFSVSDKLDVVIKHDSDWDDFDKTKVGRFPIGIQTRNEIQDIIAE